MSNLHTHALTEFKVAGWLNDKGEYIDEMQGAICANILKLIDIFAEEGHSGTTAPYAIDIFKKVASFKPLTPLTGEDDEWVKHDYGNYVSWQNKRLSSVFKNADGSCHDIDGKVFWEWAKSFDDDGNEIGAHKSYYTGRGCATPVTFPYMPPDKPIYEYRYSDATPQQPPQNESGFLPRG